MLFGQRTPESLLQRSDSKDPATTCKGITSTGRLCRRALASGTNSSHLFRHNHDGVLAVLDAGEAAVFFCWQHKDQAESLVIDQQRRSTILPLRKRTSVDTLIERFGVLEIDECRTQDHGGNRIRVQGHTTKERLPQAWQNIQGPLMTVPEEVIQEEKYNERNRARTKSRPQGHAIDRVGRSNVKASWSCCIRLDTEDNPLPARRRHNQSAARPPHHGKRPSNIVSGVNHQETALQTTPVRRKPVAATSAVVRSSRPIQSNPSPHTTPVRPQIQSNYTSTSPPNSQTLTLLSYIPPHLSPSIASSLLTELSRPISEADEEGFIYIFWLTPESDVSKPDDETASSILDADESPIHSPRPGGNRRHSTVPIKQGDNSRASQALQRYASIRNHPEEPRKILLKIGRASNVHRRLTQWSKQCGQNITLIRYYPHVSNQSSSSGLYPQIGNEQRTVPHVHRVERLIHLELADKRVTDKDECQTCGRVHREWFEVEATKRGVKEVDEVIKRWVSWAEQHS